MKKYMSKKLGIISDTHNKLRPEVLEILKTCDCILHAGDVTKEEILDETAPIRNSFSSLGTLSATVLFFDIRFWLICVIEIYGIFFSTKILEISTNPAVVPE